MDLGTGSKAEDLVYSSLGGLGIFMAQLDELVEIEGRRWISSCLMVKLECQALSR